MVSFVVNWLFGLVAAVLLGAFLIRKLRHSTVYLSGSFGFVGMTFGKGEDDRLQPVSRDRYERILERFVQGDLFDTLWVSMEFDRYGGVVLSHEEGEIEMSISFRILKEPDRARTFREQMTTWGYPAPEENQSNVGFGPDSESLDLNYRLVNDFQQLLQAVDRTLGALQGGVDDVIFVHAWRSQDGPTGTGIKVNPMKDVLAEVP